MTTSRTGQIREQEIVEELCRGGIALPPLDSIEVVSQQPPGGRGRPDALLDILWAGQRQRFAAEIKATWTPKAVASAMSQATAWSEPPGILPMVIVPFLAPAQILTLEKNGVSGIDLCGNGIVSVPPRLLIFRSGEKNRFRDSRPIQNVYRRVSSLVARVFLLRGRYDSVSAVLEEIRSRNGEMVLSTVSKALSRLQDDLVIGKEDSQIRLIQSDTLMDKLERNYTPPETRAQERFKCEVSLEQLFEVLNRVGEGQAHAAVTGASSVGRYATLATERTVSIYCSRLQYLLEGIEPIIDRSSRFPNVELIETRDPTVYFDLRSRDGIPWASPIQTWLELATGDKRQQQAALQVRERIIKELDLR